VPLDPAHSFKLDLNHRRNLRSLIVLIAIFVAIVIGGIVFIDLMILRM
jgi:hypothetical protein